MDNSFRQILHQGIGVGTEIKQFFGSDTFGPGRSQNLPAMH
jgi:hypothetical protein